MAEPITTLIALTAAHRTFHSAHPHICKIAHTVVSKGSGHLLRELSKQWDSKTHIPQSLPTPRSK
jgi:hypothetical protein